VREIKKSYKEVERDRQTDRERYRQTDREREVRRILRRDY